ncbi:MAG: hypothetical protein AB1465_00630 [Patescibacteria group bacterium]
MKKTLIIVLAVILTLAATTAVFAKSKKAKIWSGKKLTKVVKSIRKSVTTLQTKVAALEASDAEAVLTKTYEGTIDLTGNGDKTTSCENSGVTVTCHWKEISVPELDLTKSPNVQVLFKGAIEQDSAREDLGVIDLPTGAWSSGAMTNAGRDSFALDNGKVYILYKASDGTSLTDGAYKVILTYKK